MHIIQKQTIDIRVGDRSGADFWQDRMSMVCNDLFTEKLDDILSSHFLDFDKTTIDNLEVDLGTISKSQSAESLALQFETALIHAISGYKKKYPLPDQNGNHEGISFSAQNSIIHYLRYGYLKWNVSNKEELRQSVHTMIRDFPKQFFQTLLSESDHKNTWIRLSQLIISDTWDEITGILLKSKKWTFKFLLSKIQLIIAHPSIRYSKKLSLKSLQQALKLILLQAYRNQILQKTIKTSRVSSLAYIWQSVIPLVQPTQTNHNLEEIVIVFTDVFNFSKQDQKLWKSELTVSQLPDSKPISKKEKITLPKRSKDIASQLSDPKSISQKEDIPIPKRSKDSALYCQHTGSVILWPFLSGFFNSCGWIDQDGRFYQHFLDRAIISIYYLCTGSFPEDETELPVMKILCGVHLEDSVDMSALPTKDELKKLDELLENITRNWSILKTDKVEAIMEPFLQRFGAVKLSEYGWLIIPEKNGIDILLQRIPWPISTIKFSWIDYLIQVDWS